ncbi:MAG: isoamylase early set domain-containing protein [Bernardetiaceae bacterium]
MSLKKQFLKSKPVCKVTFRVSQEQVPDAETVHLVGDFNQWDKTAHPLTPLKNGDFKITIDLDAEQKYAFRYLVDGQQWINDDEPDALMNNGVTNDMNSVVEV